MSELLKATVQGVKSICGITAEYYKAAWNADGLDSKLRQEFYREAFGLTRKTMHNQLVGSVQDLRTVFRFMFKSDRTRGSTLSTENKPNTNDLDYN